MSGGWQFWSLPRRAQAALALVDAAAVAVTALLLVRYPLSAHDIAGAGWLAAGVAGTIETSRRAERFRERHRDIPHKSLNPMWYLPAALLFPPGLVCLLVAFGYAWLWSRVIRNRPHRWVYNGAAAILAYAAASVFFRSVAGPVGRLPHHPAALAACFAAGAIALAVNYALVGVPIALTSARVTARQLFGGPSHQLTELAIGCLGILVAAAYSLAAWLPLAAVPVAALLQRTLVFSQLQRVTHTDPRTGLATAAWWHELASREVERALRLTENVSVLLARLDQFERVNDTWGQLAGEAILVAVASELAGNLRTYDVAGRFGGEEFAVLLPATGPAQAVMVAERLRSRIAALRIAVPSSEGAGLGTRTDQVTVSIGIAALPDQASDLTGLLARADMALYAARQAGPDLVRYLEGPGEESSSGAGM